ncbi:hypothetical protein DPMN_173429 [Dreissena polymorpha]|uniref:Uncharacterized protein n=1 Tax=Dreissena polymorpha TaxID=45954 RepID=A0A9D4E4L7_DREPO|nr:hypothetical protein DPMN_173429 [Dreissena polymorpha]
MAEAIALVIGCKHKAVTLTNVQHARTYARTHARTKHCVVDLYLWASRFFVEPTYGELDIFVTIGGFVYVVRVRLVWSLVVFRSKNCTILKWRGWCWRCYGD